MGKKILIFLIIFFSLSFTSSMILDSIEIDKLYPGQIAKLDVEIKNTLNYDVEDVSLSLVLDRTDFTTKGSSEYGQEEIEEGDRESFVFELKASTNIKPGDYNIPYELKYLDDSGNVTVKTGNFGISVGAKTELNYEIETENNIVGNKGKIYFKIINSGLGNVGFVSVKIISASGLEMLSNQQEYLGTIDSDDFESAMFEVLYKQTIASINAQITYKDFENKEEIEIVTLPIKIYSKEKAIELGLIKKTNYGIYFLVLIVLGIWFSWKRFKKRKKK